MAFQEGLGGIQGSWSRSGVDLGMENNLCLDININTKMTLRMNSVLGVLGPS